MGKGGRKIFLRVKKLDSSVKERENTELLEGPTYREIGLSSYGKQRTFL